MLFAKWVEAFSPNGTPHLWLHDHGLTNYVSDDLLDIDGDGMLTWEEYIAGTDPTNHASRLLIEIAGQNEDGTVLEWNSVSGRTYGIERSTNLTQGFTPLPGLIAHPTGTYTDQVDRGDNAVFYILNVEKE